MAIATHPLAFPLSGDGMSGEGRGIVRDSNAEAAVARRVVNAVGDPTPLASERKS